MGLTQDLCGIIEATRYESLDDSCVSLVKRAIKDGVAVALAGGREPPVQIMTEHMLSLGGAPQASVWVYAHEGRGHTSRVHQLPGDARARFRTDVEPAHARGVADRSRCVRAGRDAAARRTRYHPRGRQRARDPGQAAVRWGSVRARSATIPSARRRRSSRQRGRRGRHARLEHTRVAPRTGSRGLARRSAARERRLHDEGDALRKCRGVGPRCGAACPARLHG